MDAWVEWWNNKARPVADQVGHQILGPWINEASTKFIWIRTYESAEDAQSKDEAFSSSPAWQAIAGEAAEFIAKIEVTPMSSPAPSA
jgi:hypothetical protein